MPRDCNPYDRRQHSSLFRKRCCLYYFDSNNTADSNYYYSSLSFSTRLELFEEIPRVDVNKLRKRGRFFPLNNHEVIARQTVKFETSSNPLQDTISIKILDEPLLTIDRTYPTSIRKQISLASKQRSSWVIGATVNQEDIGVVGVKRQRRVCETACACRMYIYKRVRKSTTYSTKKSGI